MKKTLIFIVNCLILTFVSCEKPSEPEKNEKIPQAETTATAHNARNSLDYLGTYKGVLPCADCEGIETTIVLNKDETYVKTTNYLGKEKNTFEELGDFTWMEDGNTLSLEGVDSEPVLYKVEEGKLIMLDQNGKKVTGNLSQFYELIK
jgi:uncharacterized lipoprotein NlpE involved in copper resistance